MLLAEANEEAVFGLGEADYSQGLPTMGDFGQITDNTAMGIKISGASWLALGIVHDFAKFGGSKTTQGAFAVAETVAGGAAVYYGSQIVMDDRVPTVGRWIAGISSAVIGLWSFYDLYAVTQRGAKMSTLSQKGKRTLKLVTGQGF